MNDNPLFREQAVSRQEQRLYGSVILQSSPLIRLLVTALCIFVIISVFWVATARYSRTEPVKGILVPAGGASKVFALHPGVISALMVREGDMVKAGQNLALIKLDTPNAKGHFESEETLESLSSRRLLANQQIQLAHERARYEAGKANQAISGLREQEAMLNNQIQLQKQIYASALSTFDRLDTIVKKGFISKVEYERRRQMALSAGVELSRLNQQLASTRSDILRLRAEKDNISINDKEQQASAETSIEELRQQRSHVESESDYLIKAPLSGRVTAIQTSVGQTVGSSIPMMVIMPEKARLFADLYVPSRSIGFIKPGQEIRLLYDAFPYQRFGSFPAHVANVSQIAIAGNEVNAPFRIEEPVYRVTALPEKQQILAYGKPVKLQPGMTLVANVVLERQTFLDWLLSPLRAVTNRA